MMTIRHIGVEAFRLLGFVLTDKDRISAPFTQKQPKKSVKQVLADNVDYDDRGRAWVVEETSECLSFDLLSDHTARKLKSDISSEELEKALKKGLNEDKLRKLKPIWAQGMSAAKCAQIYKNERGYSARTVEKYWAFFNAPTPSR